MWEKRKEKSSLEFHKEIPRKMLGQSWWNQHTNQHVSGFSFGMVFRSFYSVFLGKGGNATIGVSFDGDPPLQKFKETNSEKQICQDLKLDPKKFHERSQGHIHCPKI